ncbi:MAG: hypothetical protein CMJ48_06675 [Planctomycetaceae bacterium]|nr:hypothetical protein [Planctomycetaceae bacterium]
MLMPFLTEAPGTQIGPYTLREQIGEGGMGVVHVAEQTEPVRRKVALKIIKPGMDSKQVIARFEAERQALAMMSHPNIAKILDAGTTEEGSRKGDRSNLCEAPEGPSRQIGPVPFSAGRPYFVMELVNGIPITEYCDEYKLSTRRRLKLFATVCRAVQHAHQKGIIHRDLKPTNVLVTRIDGAGVPKIIDFGVAKAINREQTERTVYTQFAQLVGTPLYMSPEQAELSGVDVDTRSDVYSLGVLLYELLAGETPFDKQTLKEAGFDEMRRIIREDEPPRPSTRISTLHAEALSTLSEQRGSDSRKLSRTVRGELDWLVMKALEKGRDRRYESASAFADDIERFLKDEPVEACPPSVGYRLRKYAKRHKGLLSTVALLVATMLVATGVSVSYAVRADAEKGKAVGAQELANQRLVLANDRFESERKAKEEAAANFQHALEAVDRMLTRTGMGRLWDVPEMLTLRADLLEDAVKLYRELLEQRPGNSSARFQLGVAQFSLGEAFKHLGQMQDAEPALRSAVAILGGLVQQFPDEPKYQSALATAYNRLGWSLGRAFEERETAHRKAASLYSQLCEKYADEAAFGLGSHQSNREGMAHSYGAIADVLRLQGRLSEAEAFAHRAVDLLSVPENNEREYLAASHHSLAKIQQQLELFEKADASYQNAIRLQREFLRDEPPHATNQHHLASKLLAHGRVLEKLDRNDRAEQCYKEAADIWRRLSRSYPNAPAYGRFFATAQKSLIALLVAAGRTDDVSQLIGEMTPQTAEEYARRARLFAQANELDKALADYETALRLFDEQPDSLPEPHLLYQSALLSLTGGDTERYRELSRRLLDTFKDSENPLGMHLAPWTCALAPDALDDYTPALALAQRALETAPESNQVGVGAVQLRAGRYADALANLAKAKPSKNASRAYAAYLQAMTEFHLDHKNAARQSLDQANELAKGQLGDADNLPRWDIRLTLELLRKEAEILIGVSRGLDQIDKTTSRWSLAP